MLKEKNTRIGVERNFSQFTLEKAKVFIRGLLASALILPLWAPVAVASPRGTLNQAEAARYIRGFEIRQAGATAQVAGQVFSECAAHLEVRAEESYQGSQDNFLLIDKGDFKTCMDTHASEDCSIAEEGSCSAVTSPTLSLEGDRGEIHLVSIRDGQRSSETLGSFESSSARTARQAEETRRRDAEAAQRARTEETRRNQLEVRRLQAEFRSCRDNLSEIETARRAVDGLRSLSVIDLDRASEMLTELDNAEITQFERRIRRADDVDALEDLREELGDFADDKCELADRLEDSYASDDETDVDDYDARRDSLARQVDRTAELYRQLAVRRVALGTTEGAENSGAQSIAANREAAAIVGEAQDIDCLPRNTKRALSNYQRDLAVDRCSTIAQQGSAFAFDLQQCQQNLTVGLQQDVARLCQGPAANGMECASARRAQMVVSQQIPNLARQASQREQQQWQQMQQMMSAPPTNASSGMPLMPTTPNLLWSGGSYGGS